MSEKPTIGFIGLGTIGLPMAVNLQKAGYAMKVYDLNQEPVIEMTKLGAEAFGSPAEVAANSDVIITMVPDAPDVEKAALGDEGIIHGIQPGSIYMDMSTIDPATTRKVGAAIAEKGARMVDCPVARTVKEAREGKLAIIMGGDPTDIEAVQPILNHIGDTFTYCGPLGNGEAMKLVNNYVAACIIAAHAEALSFGVRAGLKLEEIMDVLGGTFAGNRMLAELLPSKAFKGNFKPGFFTSLSLKDTRLALKMAKDAGVTAPVGSGLYQTLEATCRAGYASQDLTSMLKVREAEAGIKVRLEKMA
jgi:3-hydroxyisobutyrate dehydrogenase-like beta-hydroxyacid dehydrogenase